MQVTVISESTTNYTYKEYEELREKLVAILKEEKCDGVIVGPTTEVCLELYHAAKQIRDDLHPMSITAIVPVDEKGLSKDFWLVGENASMHDRADVVISLAYDSRTFVMGNTEIYKSMIDMADKVIVVWNGSTDSEITSLITYSGQKGKDAIFMQI